MKKGHPSFAAKRPNPVAATYNNRSDLGIRLLGPHQPKEFIMTATMESTLTPAGASLIIHRRGRWSRVTVDRWRITDATEVEQWWADGVALAAAYACFGRGRTTAVESTIGSVAWEAMCPREDELALVQAFTAVDNHDFTAVVDYIRGRVWADAPAYRRWIAASDDHNATATGLPVPVQMMPARQARSVQHRVDPATELSAMMRTNPYPVIASICHGTPAANL